MNPIHLARSMLAAPQFFQGVKKLRKNTNLCSLLGHRRDKSRIRPVNEAWRSNCSRCGVALERTSLGKWVAFAGEQRHLAVHPASQSIADPFARSTPLRVVNDRESEPEHQTTFARNLVNAIVPQVRGANERRAHYIVRAEEARLLGEAAEDQQIKVVHLEMAARYYSLANFHLDTPAPVSAAVHVRRAG